MCLPKSRLITAPEILVKTALIWANCDSAALVNTAVGMTDLVHKSLLRSV